MTPAGVADPARLVEQANSFQERALQALDRFLQERSDDRDLSDWPELFRVLARLEPPAPREKAARLLAGRAAEAPAAACLEALRRSPEPGEQALAAEAAGFLAEASAVVVDQLLRSLGSPEPRVARAAARSLGRLGRTSAAAAEALLGDRGEAALEGLALLCESRPKALERLREAAGSEAPEQRRAVARALAEASPFPAAALPLLEKLLEDPRRDIQAQALTGLARASARYPGAAERLRRLATATDHPLRLRAVRSLAEAAGGSAEARQSLQALLPGAEAEVAVAAAMGLGVAARQDLRTCLPMLADLARHPDPEVAGTLAQVAAEVGASRPGEVVFGLVAWRTGPAIMAALARSEGPAATLAGDLVRLWTADGDPVGPLAMLRETLAQMGPEVEAPARLYSLLENLTHLGTVDEILASAADLGLALPSCAAGAAHLEVPLQRLYDWVDRFSAFETQTDPEVQSETIRHSLEDLDRIWEGLDLPEGRLLAHLAARWKQMVLQTLFASRRGAEISLQVVDRKLVRGAGSSLSVAVRNLGPGVAYDIAVELLPGPDFTVQAGRHAMASLPAGETRVVDFSITPAAVGQDRFRVEFRGTWSDFADTGHTVATAEEVTCRGAEPFTPIPNPYIPGLPLEVGSELFLGRDDLFKFILDNLQAGPQKRVIVLVGLRRMGKTSVLKQLPLRLPSEYLPVFVDCQGLEHQGLGNLLYHLCYIIADTLRAEGIPHTIPDLASIQDRPLFTFEYQFIKPVVEALGGRTLLLLVDEFQALDEAVEAGQLDEQIFGFLRSLMQHQPKVFFMFSGLQKQLEEARDFWQPVFNVALRREIGLLDEAHARELVTRPVEGRVRFDPMALDELYQLCAGHPYLTQLYCDRLVTHLNEVGDDQVRVNTVHEVMAHVFSAGVNHFYSLWEDMGPREKIVLIAISMDLARQRFSTLSSITRYLRERGISAELDEVTAVLQTLLGRAMIKYANTQPPGYAFSVPLFRMWIEKEMLQALVGGKLSWR